MLPLTAEEILPLIRQALAEDVGPGDVTSMATVPEMARASARMVAREPLVVAGLLLAETTFREVAPTLQITTAARDGDRLDTGQTLLTVSGTARGILTAERVALNFVQRLSGIATLTAQFVTAIEHTRTRILDTRKTTPGLRRLEKYAVRCGGGHNHRFGLYDRVLIKDNHLAALADARPNPVAAAVKRARSAYPELLVEVEADTLDQVSDALAAGADIILLDNMTPQELKEAVRRVAGQAQTEASGGVNLQTVRSIAATGVDFISVGALTHSARAVDIALDFDEEPHLAPSPR